MPTTSRLRGLRAITCPRCDHRSRAPGVLVGDLHLCRACGSVFVVGGERERSTVETPAAPPPAAVEPIGPVRPPVERPTRIGRYDIVGQIGRGAMGVVYEARDAAGRVVAIKLMSKLAGGGEDGLARFLAEARVVGKLDHPGIVPVLEVGTDGDDPFLVMPRLPGNNLEKRLRTETLEPKRIAAIGRDVALALHHAHQRGVIHRDVKPQNVLFDAEGRACLTDFGLAVDAAEQRRRHASGWIIGTPFYMSPEQATGAHDDHAPTTDVWALGVMLYRALTGRLPFGGKSSCEVIDRIIAEAPVAPRAIDPSIPEALQDVIDRCLRKRPSRRYASALEVANALGRFIHGVEPAARLPRETPLRFARLRRLLPRAGGRATLWGSLAVACACWFAVGYWTGARGPSAEQAARDARIAARIEALVAAGAFDLARERGEALPRQIADGLLAVEAAARAQALAPDDAAARARTVEAALAVAELAEANGADLLAEAMRERAAQAVR